MMWMCARQSALNQSVLLNAARRSARIPSAPWPVRPPRTAPRTPRRPRSPPTNSSSAAPRPASARPTGSPRPGHRAAPPAAPAFRPARSTAAPSTTRIAASSPSQQPPKRAPTTSPASGPRVRGPTAPRGAGPGNRRGRWRAPGISVWRPGLPRRSPAWARTRSAPSAPRWPSGGRTLMGGLWNSRRGSTQCLIWRLWGPGVMTSLP
mmetsp:Transcript_51568/g.117553  ORF Transcript_51568/g.117553 Transcript_51568/m.117553 type:complete len:207 (-) Transcript_51568:350-970(-)